MSKKSSSKKISAVVFGLLAFVIGVLGSFYLATYITIPDTDEVFVSDDIYYSNETGEVDFADVTTFGANLSVHFLELGNKYTGDCIFIQTETSDILIDCGSKSNSVSAVSNYLNQYVKDGKLEYVIVTHAHQDHYAGFATSTKVDSIFDLYKCETIIDFAKTNQPSTSTMYQNYKRELADEIANGANHFTALDCVNETNGANSSFEIGEGVTLTILDSYYYSHSSSTENNYSVCCLINQVFENGEERNLLFTGDLESDGEEYLVSKNANLPEVDLYKAGHHGSKTSSSETLLEVIKPKVVCVCCCAGSSEYTSNVSNQFPTQDFINRIAQYTDKVYVTTLCEDYKNGKYTSFNGNIVFLSKKGEYAVACSNNNTILKDTEWFSQSRECPDSWK